MSEPRTHLDFYGRVSTVVVCDGCACHMYNDNGQFIHPDRFTKKKMLWNRSDYEQWIVCPNAGKRYELPRPVEVTR